MVRPASRESNLGISTSYESNFGISTSYEAFADFQTMAATEQLIDYLHGFGSPIGENFIDILSPNGNCSSPGLYLLCCLVTTSLLDHAIDVDERKETEQRSLFDLFQRAMGAKKFILQTKDGNRLRQSGFYCKDRSHPFPSRRHPTCTRTSSTRFPPSVKYVSGLRKERFTTKRDRITPVWFNEWHQRTSSYYLHGQPSYVWRKSRHL